MSRNTETAGRSGSWRRYLALAGLIGTVMALGAAGVASAQTPGAPVSGDGITPTEYDGNTSCQALGYAYGFKIEGNGASVYTGTFPFDLSNGGTHTGGAPDDPYNSVTLSSDGYYLNWMSTLGLDAVIMKGGQDSNAYVYVPEDTADTGLASPALSGGQLPQISHVEFCYDYELTATKTAYTSFTRTYAWDISKSVTPDAHSGFAGDTFSSDYDVVLDQTVTDSNFVVYGSIIVTNGTPFTVSFVATDSVGGTPAAVSCPTNTLAPGANTICTYTASLASKTDGTNTATVTSNTAGIGGATASADYAFGDPTSVVGYPTVNVTDSVQGPLGSASDDKTFEYSDGFACPTDASFYVNGVYSFEVPNRATITETGQYDDAKVTVTCYAPVVTKDATASYTRTFTWEIDKSVDPVSHSGFAGDTFSSDYDVFVDRTATDGNFAVSGTISVFNPADEAMTVEVTDMVDGVAATVNCGGGSTSLTVPAGQTGTCSYSASLATKTDGTNTATATINRVAFTGSANYAFGDPTTIVGYPTVNVTDSVEGVLGEASGDYTFEYSDGFACPTDASFYVNGVYSFEVPNRATITETGQFSDAKVTVTCYAPVVTKDATASYTRTFTWEIDKSVDPASHSGFIGDTFSSDYDVFVDRTATDSDFAVSGTISVFNPGDQAMTVEVADMVDGVAATVDCGPTLLRAPANMLTVPAGETGTCSYSASLGSKTDGTNTATATINGVAFTGSANYAFGDPTTIAGYPTVNVTDSVQGVLGEASDDYTFEYSDGFACPTDASLYVNGVYSFEVPNTATIDETGQFSDAKVTVTCYAPVVSKTAVTTTYDQYYEWTLSKLVDPTSQSGHPGDYLDWTWTVNVTKTALAADNAYVSGVITVVNTADEPMTVMLADALSDGTIATIYADADCDYASGFLTVPADSTATCDYDAKPDGIGAEKNVVTATLNDVEFKAHADITWMASDVNATATLTDLQGPLDEDLTGAGPWTFTYTDDHTCSTLRSAYTAGAGYAYGATLDNTATLTDSDGGVLTADASTTYTCSAGFVDIIKTTNGAIDPTKDIRFKLYKGTTDLGDEVSTLNDADGRLGFATALIPGDTYTVCESPVPAGYTFEISVDGGNVLTYAGPPGASNPTGEVQCFDFVAVDRTTLLFEVNNSYPGGAPRTPGYWKNWSSCSGGNQAVTAEKLGGTAEGVYLLDDLLPQTVGDLNITTCEDGVMILDARTLAGKNMASDAAFTLARAYLAALLNQDAGACVPMGTYDGMTFQGVMNAAQALLAGDPVNFDGYRAVLGPKTKFAPLKAQALALYEILDDYNNGYLCDGTPSH